MEKNASKVTADQAAKVGDVDGTEQLVPLTELLTVEPSPRADTPFQQPGRSSGYKLWCWDSQERPTFGTTALDKKRQRRNDMSIYAVFQMYSQLSQVLAHCGIPPDGQCILVYNATAQRSQAFHIKCCLDADVYFDKYVPVAGKSSTPPISVQAAAGGNGIEVYAERAKQDNYAAQIMSIFTSGTGVPLIDNTTLLRAANDTILEIGNVVILREPIGIDFADVAAAIENAKTLARALDALEAEVRSCLGETIWFSVGIILIPGDKVILAAKVDQECFFARLECPEDLKHSLSERFSYKSPDRSYHKPRSNGRRQWRRGEEQLGNDGGQDRLDGERRSGGDWRRDRGGTGGDGSWRRDWRG